MRLRSTQGQSIIEIIVAMAIGVILIVGGVAAITPTLKITKDVARIQVASALGKELLENVRAFSEADWHNIDGLATTSASSYYLIASSSPFTVATGTEQVVLATTTYTRYFYLDDVHRNPSGQIDTGSAALDPSTKKITVVYSWLDDSSNTIVSYLTRARDDVLFVDDWSGGGGQDGPVTSTSTNFRFATSSNIDPDAHPGSLVITGF